MFSCDYEHLNKRKFDLNFLSAQCFLLQRFRFGGDVNENEKEKRNGVKKIPTKAKQNQATRNIRCENAENICTFGLHFAGYI